MRYGVERADSSSVEQQRRLLGRLFLSLCADISVDGGWFCVSSEIWGSVEWKGGGNMEQKTWIDIFWRFEIVMEASIENEISYS